MVLGLFRNRLVRRLLAGVSVAAPLLLTAGTAGAHAGSGQHHSFRIELGAERASSLTVTEGQAATVPVNILCTGTIHNCQYNPKASHLNALAYFDIVVSTPTNAGGASLSTNVRLRYNRPNAGTITLTRPENGVVTLMIPDNGNVDGTRTVTVSAEFPGDDAGDTSFYWEKGHTAVTTATLTILDDESPTLGVGAVTGQATEAGVTSTFTVKLNTQPTANVTVAVSSTDTGEGTVSPSSMTFTPSNWNSDQTVTVTGANDSIDDGDQNYDITLDPASTADANYNGLANVDVGVTTTDDDTAGITLSDLGAGTPRETVTEATGASRTATFDVELDSEPTANVVIALSSTDTSEGTVSPASLTFTASNWNSTQTVTLTGVDDFVDDGDQDYAVRLASPTGSDSVYTALSQRDVAVRTVDDDTKGVTVTPTELTIAEGGSGTYTVVLDAEPAANVTLTLTSGDAAVTPDVSSVTFGTGNWNGAVTVTATVATDNDDYAKGGVTIGHTVSGTGSGYEDTQADAVVITVQGGSADRRIAMHRAGTTNYEINGQAVTVTVSEGVDEEVEVAPPAALGQDLAITLSRVSSNVPLTGSTYTLGDGTVVDIDVAPVPSGGLEICLPYSAELETAATGRPLLLLHYDEGRGEWEAVSGTTLRTNPGGSDLICATVSVFSAFGVGYVDIPDQVYTVNTPITALILPELVDGDVDYTLSPALPVGLSLNAGTRTISGTPTEEQVATDYTWEVVGGTAMMTFAITVENSRDKERARLRRINESIVPELARALTDSVGRAIRERLEGAGGGSRAPTSSFGNVIQGNAQSLEDGTFKWRQALSGQNFALPLNGADTFGNNLTLWGAGDWRDLALDTGWLDWDGDAFSWHLGIDTEWGTNKTAGVSVSWFESDIDYKDSSEGETIKGDHESEMVSIHPYLGWSGEDGSRMWATVGYGEGEITIDDEDLDEKQRSDSTLKTLSAGGSMRVYERDDLKIAIRGEGQTTRWRIDDNGDRIDGITIDTHRLRLAAEGSRRQVLETGAILTSSLELGVRYDGGDGETGSGVEIGGDVGYSNGGLRLRTHGRYLVTHSGDLDEWGLGGALEWLPAANGRGLRFSVIPSWGTTGGGIGALWERGLALKDEDEAADTALQLETELGYGLYHRRGLLTPYLGLRVRDEGRHYRLGSEYKFTEALTLKLEGERLEYDDEDTEHGIGVQAVIRW